MFNKGEEKQTFTYSWEKCKSVQPLWSVVQICSGVTWQYLSIPIMYLSADLVIPFLGNYPTDFPIYACKDEKNEHCLT